MLYLAVFSHRSLTILCQQWYVITFPSEKNVTDHKVLGKGRPSAHMTKPVWRAEVPEIQTNHRERGSFEGWDLFLLKLLQS